MVLASSRLGMSAHKALGCIAGLTTFITKAEIGTLSCRGFAEKTRRYRSIHFPLVLMSPTSVHVPSFICAYDFRLLSERHASI